MKKAIIWTLCLLPVVGVAQTRTIVDDHKKFVYSDTAGVTASYIQYFGPAFDPGPLQTFDGLAIPDSGAVTVYNFWFTYCAPCVAEIPTLNRIANSYAGAPVRFVAFTWDATPRLTAFLEKQPFRFKIVSRTKEQIQDLKKVSLYPCTIITDRRRKITFALFGRTTGGDQEALYGLLDGQVRKALEH